MVADTYYRTLGSGELCFNDRKYSIIMGIIEPLSLDKKFLEDQENGVKYYTYLNKRVVKNKIKPHKFILWDRKKKVIYKKVINKI
jgi:hypothetical protein